MCARLKHFVLYLSTSEDIFRLFWQCGTASLPCGSVVLIAMFLGSSSARYPHCTQVLSLVISQSVCSCYSCVDLRISDLSLVNWSYLLLSLYVIHYYKFPGAAIVL
jgi:hypothetical protein